MSGGSNVKARFEAMEGGGSFDVQYNPKEFKADKSVSWKEHDDQGQGKAPLEFQKGGPLVVTMDLYFDTTNEGGDVRAKWVNHLLFLTNPTIPDGGDTKKKRPPKINFIWGSFSVVCVIESVNTTFLMFAESGAPVRARCSVKLKEFEVKDFEGGQGGSFIKGSKVKLVTSSGGTASAIAAANGVSTAALLAANPSISDPMDVPAGMTLNISGSIGGFSASASLSFGF